MGQYAGRPVAEQCSEEERPSKLHCGHCLKLGTRTRLATRVQVEGQGFSPPKLRKAQAKAREERRGGDASALSEVAAWLAGAGVTFEKCSTMCTHDGLL